MSAPLTKVRPLHFVFKVANRAKTMAFYRNTLSMRVLRHEEFSEGCKATCNGPYDGKWSKTMIGYGDEDAHFVIELTYNYGVREYKLGNDFNHLRLSVTSLLYDKILSENSNSANNGQIELQDPNGYKFLIEKSDQETNHIVEFSLASSSLPSSINYWTKILNGQIVDSNTSYALIKFSGDEKCGCQLRLKETSAKIDHGTAFGRVAFACATSELSPLQAAMDEAKQRILTRLVSLDTPGKATVNVVILADPDGHEICFVGDEGFRELSRTDPKAEQLLDEAMAEDKSDEWHQKQKNQ